MLIDTNKITSLSEANQNFSAVVKRVDKNGSVVVLKNNKPKYVIKKFEDDISEDEKFELIAKSVLLEFLPAFKELAK